MRKWGNVLGPHPDFPGGRIATDDQPGIDASDLCAKADRYAERMTLETGEYHDPVDVYGQLKED